MPDSAPESAPSSLSGCLQEVDFYVLQGLYCSAQAGHVHRVAITLEVVYAVDASEEAFARYGLPDVVNIDQGGQLTAGAFTEAVSCEGIRLSMDGKGSWRDNVFVERVCAVSSTSRSAMPGVPSANTPAVQAERLHLSLADHMPGGIVRDAAYDQVGSMTVSDVPPKNMETCPNERDHLCGTVLSDTNHR